MKKTFVYIVITTLIIIFFSCYLLKTYSPTALGWQNDLVTHLTKLTDIFYFPHSFKPNTLPQYNLFIDPKDSLVLEESLPNPKQTRVILSINKPYVQATFSFKDLTQKVETKYRGFHFDHWVRPKKSWRIKFKKNESLDHQSAISLIIPEDRGMYLEELSQFRAKKLNLIVPQSQFVHLTVNHIPQGVYWQVEHWTPEFLTNNHLPLSSLYGEDDQAILNDPTTPIYQSVNFWSKLIETDENHDPYFTQLIKTINLDSDSQFFSKLPQILDIDTFLRWQAHTVLMGSYHQDSFHNARFYWHPDNQKFIIIPWDVLGSFGWPKDYNLLVTRVLKNPDWFNKRNQVLAEYVDNPINLQQDLEYYDQLFNQTKSAIYSDSQKYFSNFGYTRQVNKSRQHLIDQFNLIKTAFKTNNIPDQPSTFMIQ